MSDVLDELERKLKQKAKFGSDIKQAILDAWRCYELQNALELEEWVRLEDVKAILQQLKQKYVLIKIGDLEAVVFTSTKYESLRDIVDDFCGNYDDVAREAYALGMKNLAKRLLRE